MTLSSSEGALRFLRIGFAIALRSLGVLVKFEEARQRAREIFAAQ